MSEIICVPCGHIGNYDGVKWHWDVDNNVLYTFQGGQTELICENCGIVLKYKKNSDFKGSYYQDKKIGVI